MVLLDVFGGKIHAYVRKTLAFKFFNQLKEGDVYKMTNFGIGRNVGNYKITQHEFKLNFENATTVWRLNDSTIPNHGFTFIEMSDLSKNDFDTSYLVGVGSEKDYEDKDGNPCRFNVIELQAKGCKVDCALFGSYVKQLNDFLFTGDVSNVVVIIQFARVKQFKGKFVLQNNMYATKVFYNLDVPIALEFENSFDEYQNLSSELLDGDRDQNLESEFLTLYERKTIEEMKDWIEDCICIVLGNVNQFMDDEDWLYTSCTCNRDGFLCQPCKMILLYKIRMRVIDESDSCSIVIFDEEGAALLKKTCEELVAPFLKRAEDTTLPVELTSLVGKTFLFKIEVKIPDNSKFEPSYRVKRITDDADLIDKFKSSAPKTIDFDCTIGSVPESKFIFAAENNCLMDGKNLLADFSLGEADKDSSFGENCEREMLTKGLELTPSK